MQYCTTIDQHIYYAWYDDTYNSLILFIKLIKYTGGYIILLYDYILYFFKNVNWTINKTNVYHPHVTQSHKSKK